MKFREQPSDRLGQRLKLLRGQWPMNRMMIIQIIVGIGAQYATKSVVTSALTIAGFTAGVLLGVASKNDPSNVQAAFEREDLLLATKSVFPVEASWEPKSESVARILKAWNVGEDAVVFVDDSPMELAQVSSAFPAMTTVRFPTADAQSFWEMLGELRDLFGKPGLSDEDRIRAPSLRAGAHMKHEMKGPSMALSMN